MPNVSSIVSEATSIASSAVSFATSIASSAVSDASSLASDATSIASSVVSEATSLASSATSLAGSIVSDVTSLAGSVVTEVTCTSSLLMIYEPGTLTRIRSCQWEAFHRNLVNRWFCDHARRKWSTHHLCWFPLYCRNIYSYQQCGIIWVRHFKPN